MDHEKYDLQDRIDMTKSLFGILPSDSTLEETREKTLIE